MIGTDMTNSNDQPKKSDDTKDRPLLCLTIRHALKAARRGRLLPVRRILNPERYLHAAARRRRLS